MMRIGMFGGALEHLRTLTTEDATGPYPQATDWRSLRGREGRRQWGPAPTAAEFFLRQSGREHITGRRFITPQPSGLPCLVQRGALGALGGDGQPYSQ